MNLFQLLFNLISIDFHLSDFSNNDIDAVRRHINWNINLSSARLQRFSRRDYVYLTMAHRVTIKAFGVKETGYGKNSRTGFVRQGNKCNP